jgi:hypothetical protein
MFKQLAAWLVLPSLVVLLGSSRALAQDGHRGLIDQQMVTRMQTTIQRSALTGIRQQLRVSDEEWNVLQPKIQRVVSTSAAIRQNNRIGGIAGLMIGQSPNNEVSGSCNAPRLRPRFIACRSAA